MSFIKNKIILILGFLICTLFIIYNSVYTVLEGHTAVLSRANTLAKTNPFGPGLHFKPPFFVQSVPIDMRLQSFSLKKANVLTTSGHPLVIDYYVKWQVTNPTLYYLKTGNNTQQTQQRLAQAINTLLQNEYTHTTLNNTADNNPPILHTLLMQTNTKSKVFGITVVDIGFKSINIPAEADTSLIKNMRAEQTRIAIEQRAIGKANAISIREKADNQASLLLAKAKEKAAIIRGQGDAIASKIYSEAYRKNPQFAAFYLNLETYRKGFTQSSLSNNFLVLSTQNGFFSTTKGLSQTHAKDLG